jgi:hypothetical protein
MVKILKSKFWSSTPDFLLNFYKSFIRPLVDYASFQFLVANETTKSKIQVKQNKIIRLCLNADLLDSTKKIHTTANIQMLQERQIELSQNYITKTVNTKINSLIIEKIVQQQEIDRHYNNKSEHRRKRRKTCLDYINY